MPAFNSSIPVIERSFDLRDVVDPVDRKLEVLHESARKVQQMLRDIKISPVTGAANSAGTYPRPGYVVSGGGVTAYEAAIDAALTAVTTAVTQLKTAQAQV